MLEKEMTAVGLFLVVACTWTVRCQYTLAPGANGIPTPNQTLARPPFLTFGHISTITNPLGCLAYNGVLAAFQEANRNNELNGTDLRIVAANSFADLTGANGINATLKFTSTDNAFGLIGYGWENALKSLPIAMALGVPYIGATPADWTTLYQVGQRVAVNVRFGYDNEVYQIFNYAINGPPKCHRFAIILSQYSLAYSQLAATILAALGLEPPLVVVVPYPAAFNATGWGPWINMVYANPNWIPECICPWRDAIQAGPIAEALRNHPKYDAANTYLFMTSAGNPNVLSPILDSTGSAASFGNLYVTQVLPDPFDATSMTATMYRNAMTALNTDITFCRPDIPQYPVFEAYMAARLAVEVLKRMTTFTRDGFLATVYQQRMFQVGDILLGPFSDTCSGQLTKDDLSCWCNTGTKSLYMSRFNTSSGLPIGITENVLAGEFGAAHARIPLSTCQFDQSLITLPYLFAQVATAAQEADSVFASYRASVRSLVVGLNSVKVAVKQRLFVLNATVPAGGSLNATVRWMAKRYRLLGFAGSTIAAAEVSAANVTQLSIDAVPALTIPETDPRPVAWSAQFVSLFPVLADFIHSLAAFAASQSTVLAVHVVASTDAQASLAVQSCQTFGISPASVTVVAGSFAASGSLLALAAQSSGARFLVVTQDATALRGAVTVAASYPSTSWLIACGEELLDSALPTVRATLTGATNNTWFSSMFPRWWGGAVSSDFVNQVVSLYATAENVTAAALGRAPVARVGAPSVVELKAGLLVLTLHAAASAGSVNPATFLGEWYASRTKSVKDISLGPFADAACATSTSRTSGTCECGKAPRTFYVHSLKDLSDATAIAKAWHYTESGCGAVYTLPASSASDKALTIALASAGAAVAVLMIIPILQRCFMAKEARDNSNAPKDETKPFAIVFTDIQNSTSLWAESPEEMSEAIEIHHREIRALIAKHGGYEVKTVGDSFMVAFVDPKSAVAFGVELQSRLAQVDWHSTAIDEYYLNVMALSGLGTNDSKSSRVWNGLRLRVGVHYGLGQIQIDPVTKGYDYYGTVVNTAARVETVGNGGQMLVTEAVYQAVFSPAAGKSAPTNVVYVNLGKQPLRGLKDPVQLYQTLPAELSSRNFPSLRLEVEVAEEEISDHSSASDTSSSTGKVLEPLHVQAERLVKTMWRNQSMHSTAANDIVLGVNYLKALLATSKDAYRQEFLQHMAGRWHVASRGLGDKYGPQVFDAIATRVMAKVVRTMETKQMFVRSGREEVAHVTHNQSMASSDSGDAKSDTPDH